MRFEEAMGTLRAGGRVRRPDWASFGRGEYLWLTEPTERFAGCFLMLGADGYASAWPASHRDLLAEDWEEAVAP